jgi:hypothetical protein
VPAPGTAFVVVVPVKPVVTGVKEPIFAGVIGTGRRYRL